MGTIAIIPARGGSKGIPRKSIRPVAGMPMIYWSISACLNSSSIDHVVVSTDDDEIALLASRFGAVVVRRESSLANDAATLDPVIKHAVEKFELDSGVDISFVFTVQPTSPLVQPHDIDQAYEKFVNERVDSVISVVDDRHLCWTIVGGQPKPAYEARVNRQQLSPNFRETGAVIACTRAQLNLGSRIGAKVGLLELPPERSFDIDNFSDLYLCESMLNRKSIVFVVVGYPEVGLGHAFRSTMLAHEFVDFDIKFVCGLESELAAEYIEKFNYKVERVASEKLIETIASIKPDIVINDILDTDVDYVTRIKSLGAKVVNFEDLGSGADKADLVVNALYPHQSNNDGRLLIGEKYFCLRDEFLFPPLVSGDSKKYHKVKNILLTFGGVDEGNLTTRILKLLGDINFDGEINIVLGPGFKHIDVLENTVHELKSSSEANIIIDTKRISDYMFAADLAITSAGRTVLELASICVPTLAICQNTRESTHTFASEKNGIVNLGVRTEVSDQVVKEKLIRILDDDQYREVLRERMRALDLTQGKKRVTEKIRKLLG